MNINPTSKKNSNPLAVPSFEELFNISDIQAIQDAFARAMGVASIITDTKGIPLTKPSNFCRLCKDVIRKTEKGLLNCFQSDAMKGKVHPHGPVIHQCLSGGLWDSSAGIYVKGHHIANWLVGQVQNAHVDKTQIMAYAKVIGADQEEFNNALEEVTRMPIEQFKNISEMLFLMANQLSKLAFQKLEQKQIVLKQKEVEKQLTFYKNHLEKREFELKNANLCLKQKIDAKNKIEKELKQKNEYLSALHEISLGMFSRLDLSRLLNGILKRASNLTQIKDGFLHIYNSKKDILELKAACGKYSSLSGFTLKPDQGLAGKVWETGKSIIINDYQNWSGKSIEPEINFTTSVIGVPLRSGSNIEGTIGLSYCVKDKKIGPEIISILEPFAELATIAIDNAKLFTNMQEELEKRIALENEQREMEAMLRQSQKMEAIGTLAGGIAHDFNNILSPIIGVSEMIDYDLPCHSPMKSQIKMVLDAAFRAKDLVQQILTISRQKEQQYHPLKLQYALKEVLDLSRSTLPSSIQITQNISNDIGMVMADSTQIHQIIMNLITNASHAMEDNGGQLTVNLTKVDFSEKTIPTPDVRPGKYICLEITDTGKGMDNHTIKRIFDPYFTTKENGKGTGLGLAVVHGIVKNYHGEIMVRSKPGKGTSFFVYLPEISPTKQKLSARHHPGHQLNGQESILVVDDEKAILMMMEQILTRYGYRVCSYDNSIKALNEFHSFPEDYDLIITDMTMPHMTGDKLIIELKKIRPAIPVILCSGFSEKITNGMADGVKPDKILMKPVLNDELLIAIRHIFDSRSIAFSPSKSPSPQWKA